MNVFSPISAIGAGAISILELVGGVGLLLRKTAVAGAHGLIGKRGRRLAWANVWAQMDRVGVRSVPIVMLVLFCIGSILALQTAPVLREYNAVSEVANIISVAVFREMGPLVSAIVLTGFAGASIAAEIGTMVVSEELEALNAQAINPIRFLVAPRVLATTCMTVCVAVIGNAMGVLGGYAVARGAAGISSGQYIHHTFAAIHLRDFLTGLIKAGCFGALISGLSCYLGLGVTGGAQGVGVATTRTVVLTIVALIIVDLLFTGVFYAVGF